MEFAAVSARPGPVAPTNQLTAVFHKHKSPKLPLLLVSLLAPFIAGHAAADPSLSLQPDGSLLYTGDAARVSLGYAKGGYFHGELAGVLKETSESAWLGEGWVSQSSGGLKLSYHQLLGDRVHKYFVAHDQNQTRDRKLTLGYGMERDDWFGNLNLSRGLTGRRLVDRRESRSTSQEGGVVDGRAYLDTVTQITSTRIYERAYDYGFGVRAGRYFSGAHVRLTAGYDHEWGRGNAKQNSLSLTGEKMFVGSPHSVALQVSHSRKTGDLDIGRNDTRVMVAYRYSFGGSNSQPERSYRMVAVPVSQAAPPAVASVNVPAAAESAQFEKQWVKTKANMTSDAFFEFGSAQLTAQAKAELDRVGTLLKTEGREGNVRIVGHTCDIGSEKINDRLSLQRARTVRDYLVAAGAFQSVEAIVEGKGEREPKFPAEPGLREKNRRVEMEFYSFVSKEELLRVASPPAAAMAPTQPASAAPAVTYERVAVDQPPAWMRQALRTPALHKRTVDVYRSKEETQTGTRTRDWINRAPVAQDDAYSVAAGSTTTLAVLANDTDPDNGDTLSLVSVTGASRGQVRIEGQQLVYTASPGGAGQEKFSYTIKDSKGVVSSANVVVTITTANRPPIAGNDRYVVSGRIATSLPVLTNDSDPDGDPLTIISVTQPLQRAGTVQIVGSEILFTPNGVFPTDSFSYTVSDGKGGLATAIVDLIDP